MRSVDVFLLRRIEIDISREVQPESMVTAVIQEIIDDFDDTGASPALAFIGYLKAITTDDKQSIRDFESTFGKKYMGTGACLVTFSVLIKHAQNPAIYLHSYEHAMYRRAFSPRKRAGQTFINDMLSIFEKAPQADEYDSELINEFDPAVENKETVMALIPLNLEHNRFKRVTYVQGVGYAVANLIDSIAVASNITVRDILSGLHVSYLDGGNSNRHA